MAAFLILWFHLKHDAGAMVGEVNGILLVKANSDNISVPTDTLVLVNAIKFSNSALRILGKAFEAAVAVVLIPAEA